MLRSPRTSTASVPAPVDRRTSARTRATSSIVLKGLVR